MQQVRHLEDNLAPPGGYKFTEEYNGSGWSTGGNIGTARLEF
jgi:hypothetical protein